MIYVHVHRGHGILKTVNLTKTQTTDTSSTLSSTSTSSSISHMCTPDDNHQTIPTEQDTNESTPSNSNVRNKGHPLGITNKMKDDQEAIVKATKTEITIAYCTEFKYQKSRNGTKPKILESCFYRIVKAGNLLQDLTWD